MNSTRDWSDTKRIDLRRLIVEDLGEPTRGRWRCPICQDHSERLAYDPKRNRFHCFHGACNEQGDSVDWLVKARRMSKAEALAYLRGEDPPRYHEARTVVKRTNPTPPTRLELYVEPQEEAPAYLDPHYQSVADRVIRQAARDFWETPEGRACGLAWTRSRGIADHTARKFSLGWVGRGYSTEPIDVLSDREGEHGIYVPRGIVFPHITAEGWFGLYDGKPDGPQWAGASVRRLADPDVFSPLPLGPRGKKPAKTLMFRGTPRRSLWPSPVIEQSQVERPALIVEGEVDALLAEQHVGHAAFVATLGGAGCRPDDFALAELRKCPGVLLAVDYDTAGELSVARWKALIPAANRAMPPAFVGEGDKDLGDFVIGGGDVEGWIRGEFLDNGWGWPGVDFHDTSSPIGFDWQHQVAGWPHAKWSAWHRRTWELLAEDPRGTADVQAIADAHRRAYDEMATDADREAVEVLRQRTGGWIRRPRPRRSYLGSPGPSGRPLRSTPPRTATAPTTTPREVRRAASSHPRTRAPSRSA